ncbi:MAG TPA: hypothetical protein PLJ81_01825 [Giesbergeria sp.]|nr:hypothetical protein [Giesbergeria sp.]HNE70894.1 hypothetical protein [Giesbergeria sp.]HNM38794.1 hypothetical protein [Giesbergeria sp.]
MNNTPSTPTTEASTPKAAATPAPSAKAPARKAASKPAVSKVATPKAPTAKKPAAKAPATKRTASKAIVAKPAAAKPVAAKPTKAEAKPKKPKLVRDSFTIPKDEYAGIDTLKERSVALGRPAKKSELLRAGLMALLALSPNALHAALEAVPTIKTGRPKSDK